MLVNKSKGSRILQTLNYCIGWWCKYVNKGNMFVYVCEEWKEVEEGRGGWLKIAEFKTSTELLSQPGDVTMATNSLTVTIKIYYSFESSQKGNMHFVEDYDEKWGRKEEWCWKVRNINLVILQREQLLLSTVVIQLINMVSSHNTWELLKKS